MSETRRLARISTSCDFSGGNHKALYVVRTNRISNPGKTPVTFHACGTHVSVAIYEQFRNAESLREQDMPGTDGITIEELTS